MRRILVIVTLLFFFAIIKAQIVYPGWIEGGCTESEAKTLLNNRAKNSGADSIDPMEGIWQSNTGMKFFIVGCIPKGQVWCGTHSKRLYYNHQGLMIEVLSSDDRRWVNGCIKGYIEKVPNSNTYSMTHYVKPSIGRNYEGFQQETIFLVQESTNTAFYTRPDGQRIQLIKIYSASKSVSFESSHNVTKSWTGTGFALNNNYVVTNYHVIENATNITLTGVNGSFSTKYSASIAATDKKNDLALLKLNSNANIPNIPYSVNTTTSDVGEEVFVLGYPLTATMGDEIKLTTGVISSKSGFQGDISQYQISAPIQPGNSGGPLFDSKGNIIGIVSAKHAGAENVGYAIKTSYLKTLVESVTSTNVLPQANRIATQNLSGKVKAVKNYIYYITCTR